MDNREDRFKKALKKHLPENALHYCYELWEVHNFSLKVKKRRMTKLGDYRYDSRSKQHTISVNNDLNPFSFLITYVHEVAHLVTYNQFKNRVKPHGEEWKNNFKQLMLPLLTTDTFPPAVLSPLKKYMHNPKASSCNDHTLMKALKTQDKDSSIIHLSDIPTGTLFRLNNRVFKKETLRRTRYVCSEVSSQKKYLISKIAEVEVIS